MPRINSAYASLSSSYLFSEIARRVRYEAARSGGFGGALPRLHVSNIIRRALFDNEREHCLGLVGERGTNRRKGGQRRGKK